MSEQLKIDPNHPDLKSTASPASDLAMLLMIAAAVQAAPATATAVVKRSMPLLRKEWRDRTLSRGAWEDKQQFGIEPKGLEGWRPFKAFSPKMLKTGPTAGAENAMKLLINKDKR